MHLTRQRKIIEKQLFTRTARPISFGLHAEPIMALLQTANQRASYFNNQNEGFFHTLRGADYIKTNIKWCKNQGVEKLNVK